MEVLSFDSAVLAFPSFQANLGGKFHFVSDSCDEKMRCHFGLPTTHRRGVKKHLL